MLYSKEPEPDAVTVIVPSFTPQSDGFASATELIVGAVGAVKITSAADTMMDPHVWLSPKNAITIAAAMRDELRQIDPENADHFAANFAQFEQTLSQILVDAPRVITHTNIAVSHDAYGYFQSGLGDIETITLTDAAATELTPRSMAQTLSELDQKSVACFIIDSTIGFNFRNIARHQGMVNG